MATCKLNNLNPTQYFLFSHSLFLQSGRHVKVDKKFLTKKIRSTFKTELYVEMSRLLSYIGLCQACQTQTTSRAAKATKTAKGQRSKVQKSRVGHILLKITNF